MKEDYIENTPIKQINLRDPSKFNFVSDSYLGIGVKLALGEVYTFWEGIHLEMFRLKCLDFYIEAALQISQRFPFTNKIFKWLKSLDSVVVKGRHMHSLSLLIAYFHNLMDLEKYQATDFEFKMLTNDDHALPIVENNPKILPLKS